MLHLFPELPIVHFPTTQKKIKLLHSVTLPRTFRLIPPFPFYRVAHLPVFASCVKRKMIYKQKDIKRFLLSKHSASFAMKQQFTKESVLCYTLFSLSLVRDNKILSKYQHLRFRFARHASLFHACH